MTQTVLQYANPKNTLPAKSMEYFEAQWKHSYLTFWFAGNGLAPTTTKHGHFNAFLMHSVRGENTSCNSFTPVCQKLTQLNYIHL